MFNQFFYDFRKFLGNPQQTVDGPRSRPLSTWLVVLLVDVVITMAIIVPLIHLIDGQVLHLRPIPEISKPMTFWYMVIVIVCVAPVVEELIFRYPLKFARNRVLKIAVYTSSVVFGLYHLSNYTNNEVLFYLISTIIVGSQLLGGFLLAYLRLKHGLPWSILTHAVFNALMVIPSALFMQGKTVIDYQSADYSLVVTEYAYLERPDYMRFPGKMDVSIRS